MSNNKEYRFEVELQGNLEVCEGFKIGSFEFIKDRKGDSKGKIEGNTDIKDKSELAFTLKKYCGFASFIFSTLFDEQVYFDFKIDDLRLFSGKGGYRDTDGKIHEVEGMWNTGRFVRLAKKRDFQKSNFDISNIKSNSLKSAIYWYHEALAAKYYYQSIVYLDIAIEALDFHRIGKDCGTSGGTFYDKLYGVCNDYLSTNSENHIKERFNLKKLRESLKEVHKARVKFVHKSRLDMKKLKEKQAVYEMFIRKALKEVLK